MEVHAIPQHLYDMALVTRGDFVHQLGKLQRHASRDLIPRLLGQPRVSREVGEGTALGPPRCSSMHSRFLERGLDMAEHVLPLEHLRMAPVQPPEKIFAGSPGTDAHLAHRRFQGLVVAQTSSAEGLLDRVMEVVVLELSDPSCAVPPNAGQTQDLSFTDPRTEEHRDRCDDAEILLSHELARAWDAATRRQRRRARASGRGCRSRRSGRRRSDPSEVAADLRSRRTRAKGHPTPTPRRPPPRRSPSHPGRGRPGFEGPRAARKSLHPTRGSRVRRDDGYRRGSPPLASLPRPR